MKNQKMLVQVKNLSYHGHHKPLQLLVHQKNHQPFEENLDNAALYSNPIYFSHQIHHG